MRLIAVRIAFVTLMRARSAGDETSGRVLRVRPPARALASEPRSLPRGGQHVPEFPSHAPAESSPSWSKPLGVLLLRPLVEQGRSRRKAWRPRLAAGAPRGGAGSTSRRGAHELEHMNLAPGLARSEGDGTSTPFTSLKGRNVFSVV